MSLFKIQYSFIGMLKWIFKLPKHRNNIFCLTNKYMLKETKAVLGVMYYK